MPKFSPAMDTTFSARIKSHALSLGFSKIGVTRPDIPNESRRRLSRWLDAGYNASMSWMSKRSSERLDVRTYFPEVKSVIATGVNYYTGRASGTMKISNYAWGDDYHDGVKKKLYKLLGFIRQSFPNVKYRVCVDTSPVMDKVWAQKAGLGWQGKHTNLITKDYGSWLFLGELMVDIELEPDAPFAADYCGSCTACLDACPTEAFTEPYVLDAGKCLSYLTIEHREDIPSQFEDVFGGWIFGCDICQQVCPWNQKFQRISESPGFQCRKEISDKSPEEWIDLSPEEFRKIFKNSPVKRTKFSGLMRNIKIASKTFVRSKSDE